MIGSDFLAGAPKRSFLRSTSWALVFGLLGAISAAVVVNLTDLPHTPRLSAATLFEPSVEFFAIRESSTTADLESDLSLETGKIYFNLKQVPEGDRRALEKYGDLSKRFPLFERLELGQMSDNKKIVSMMWGGPGKSYLVNDIETNCRVELQVAGPLAASNGEVAIIAIRFTSLNPDHPEYSECRLARRSQ